MKVRDNLIGNKYNKLFVLELIGKNKHGVAMWKCLCECGNVKTIQHSNLKNGHTKSCGCYRKKAQSRRAQTHGMSKTPTYTTWLNMKSRCNKKISTYYKRYGGRGIKICKRWMNFENFLSDMGEKPDGLTIERIDNNKGYEPSNCRWATRKEQMRNYSRNVLITHEGKTMVQKDWASKLNISRDTIRNRIKKGLPMNKVLSCDHKK